MEAPGGTRGPKASLSQRSQEMRVLVDLQEQGRKIFAQSCEEKLRQNRELLPSLRTALQEDSNILDFVLKVPAGPSCCTPAWCWACIPSPSRSWQHRPAKNVIPRLTMAIPLFLPCPQYNKFPIKDAFGEGHELVPATENLEGAVASLAESCCPCPSLPVPRLCPGYKPVEIEALCLQSCLCPEASCSDSASSLENGLMPIQVAIKKIEAQVHDQVKVCDMLLHQLKQWSQARDERQRHLQDLQGAETDPKWQEPQLQSLCVLPLCLPQTIRQLGNEIEKMLMKIHSGEIMTKRYLRLQEVLKRELVYLPRCLDLLSGMTVTYHEELTEQELSSSETVVGECLAGAGRGDVGMATGILPCSFPASPGADLEGAMAKMQREAFVTDKMEKAKAALQCSCLWDIPSSIQAQRKSLENLQQYIDECNEEGEVLEETLKEMESKLAELKFNQPDSTNRCCWPCTAVPTRPPPLGGTCPSRHPDLHPTAATHSSRTGRVPELPVLLLAEHPKLPLGSRSSCLLAGHGNCCQQHRAGLSSLGCPCTSLQLCDVSVAGSRLREKELREKLKREEDRRDQMRAQMLKSQRRLVEFENIIDNMFLHLQGIPIPGKEDSGAVVGLEEKLQYCEQKLQFLKEKFAARPEDSTDERSETFAKVRNLLEEKTAGEARNLKISFEDEGAMEDASDVTQGHGHSRGGLQTLLSPSSPLSPPDTLDFDEEDHEYIPSREDIKKQGLQLIRMNTRRRKKK
ncbi:coiled-coil domain-containing protein 183-like [Lonchura striata]